MRTLELLLAPWRAHMLAQSRPLLLPDDLPADRPLVIVANHTSWWDGFLLRDIQRALRRGAPFYTVMIESELKRVPFLRLVGAVPLQPGSTTSLRRMLRSLQRVTRRDRRSTVVFFPQGRIWPAWRRPLGFQRGIECVLDAVAPCTVLPVGIHMEPLNHTAPSAFVLCGRPLDCAARGSIDAADLETLVTERLDTIQALLRRYGEDAPRHIGSGHLHTRGIA